MQRDMADIEVLGQPKPFEDELQEIQVSDKPNMLYICIIDRNLWMGSTLPDKDCSVFVCLRVVVDAL